MHPPPRARIPVDTLLFVQLLLFYINTRPRPQHDLNTTRNTKTHPQETKSESTMFTSIFSSKKKTQTKAAVAKHSHTGCHMATSAATAWGGHTHDGGWAGATGATDGFVSLSPSVLRLSTRR
ncbi:hypothetical protein BZA05DRAFT_381796 [Tricharina praecox]|uniref:uncharacterized protein n=1 Tax=Tricharina praecox TaxID=43433 RepID=UPI0022208E67|nr:uncharacterized protein BZA05DRAFT_381796 [Tricharina praecox]KAI5858589.1 hypothetical protein BZA05DRAFT_381796 [Tricharina praecox]